MQIHWWKKFKEKKYIRNWFQIVVQLIVLSKVKGNNIQ